MDNIQFLMDEEKVDKTRQTPIYQFSKCIMDSVSLAMHELNTWIIPIFSGTFPLKLLDLFPAMPYTTRSVHVPPLGISDAVLLVMEELGSRQALLLQGKNRPYLSRFLAYLGPLPLLVSFVTQSMLHNPNLDAQAIYEEVKKEIANNWSGFMNTYGFNDTKWMTVLYHSFLQTRKEQWGMDPNILFLLKEGILQVQGETLGILLIVIDIVILKQVDLKNQIPYLKWLCDSTRWNESQGLEQYPSFFFALCQQLCLSQNIQQMSFFDFFRGWMQPALRTKILELGHKPMECYDAVGSNMPTDFSQVLIKGTPNK